MAGPKVVEVASKYVKIEIVPGKVLRVPKTAVIKNTDNKIIFRNPLTRLVCVAFFE